MKFPIDCHNCEYWDAWDLSFDDWVYYCGLLHVDIRDCDIKKGHKLPDCPLRERKDETIICM